MGKHKTSKPKKPLPTLPKPSYKSLDKRPHVNNLSRKKSKWMS